MARSSWIDDDIDPAPRLLRLLASSFAASGEAAGKRLAAQLRRDATVLEGDLILNAYEANRPHGRMLTRERRMPPEPRRRRGA